jgi:fibronectin type 3 domain-containing protein
MRKNIFISIFVIIIIFLSIFGLFFRNNTESIEKKEEIRNEKIFHDNKYLSNINSGFFTQNHGQWNSSLLFTTKTTFGHIGFGIKCVYFHFSVIKKNNDECNIDIIKMGIQQDNPQKEIEAFRNTLKINFIDANDAIPKGFELLTHRSNYFKSNNRSNWITGIQNFRKIIYKDIWDGIDLIYYFKNQNLKYEFIIHPYISPNTIKIGVEGHKFLNVEDNKLNIILSEELQIIDDNIDIFYYDNQKISIDGAFKKLDENKYTFLIKNYDNKKKIVIDPIVYSTLVSGSSFDRGRDVVFDKYGCAYIAGFTSSTDFPTTPSGYSDLNYSGNDVFVLKINKDGSELLYSTFLAGDGEDYSYGIKIDPTGNALITGRTASKNFPTTTNSYQTYNRGNYDVFVTKLAANGSSLLFSTLVGGGTTDYGYDIEIDSDGNTYITGRTESSNFPTTDGVWDKTHNGGTDVFVFKLNTNGTKLMYSTFIGGTKWDIGNNIVVDSKGNSYICGWTESTNFPILENTYDNTLNGEGDAFVFKLNYNGSKILLSTFIGGNEYDTSNGLCIDHRNDVFITGYTKSIDFPNSSDAFDKSFNGGNYDCFVLKFNSDGTDLMYSTYIGGSKSDLCNSIVSDSDGNVYITGFTTSQDFPLSADADDTVCEGGDVFLIKLNNKGSKLLYSNLIGDTYHEEGMNLAIANDNAVFITGHVGGPGFPTSDNAFNSEYGGYPDVFVLEYCFPGSPLYPQELQAKTGDNFVDLNWLPPTYDGDFSITNYIIYRGEIIDNLKKLKIINNKLSFNDTNVINGITYFYSVSAQNGKGEGFLSNVIRATPLSVPSPPQNIKIMADNNSLNITWEKPIEDGGTEILNYIIYRGRTSNEITFFKEISNNVYFLNDTDVENGESYYYYLRANNQLGKSNPSNIITAIPATNPSRPQNIKVFSGNKYLNISWEPPIENGGLNVTSYYIYSYSSEDKINFQKEKVINCWFNGTELLNGKIYYYRISAYNKMGEGFLSEEISAIPMTIPSPPKIINTKTGDGYIYISWQAPEDNGGSEVIEYIIYRGEDRDEGNPLIRVKAPNQYYNDTNVFNNNEYFYYIISKNEVGESKTSEVVSGIPKMKNDSNISNNFESDNSIFFIIIIVLIIIMIIVFFIILRRKNTRKDILPSQINKHPLKQVMPQQPLQQNYQPESQIPQQVQQQIPIYRCELCNASLMDPNKCPYCGWIRNF